MRRLLIGLVLLTVCGCHRQPAASVFIDPALSTAVPGDAYALVGIRLEKLLTTPAYQKYFGNRPIELLDRFQQETGIDARKDLYELLVALTDRGPITLVKGKFSDIVGRQPNLKFEGSAPVPYKGLMLLGNERGGAVFLNSSVAVLAPHAQLRALIDQRDHGPAPIVNTFLAKAANIPPDAQLWALSLRAGNPLPIPLPAEGNLANLNRVFQGIQELQAWADFRAGVNASITGTCAGDTEARRLGDTLRGFVGLARLSTPSDRPELARVYDGVQVNQIQNRVEIKASIPEELLELAVQRWVPLASRAN